MTDDREPPREDNPLGAIIDPLAQVGIDTARDLAAALQSTRAAGRDLWRLVNVLNRVPSRDQGTQQNSIPAAPGPAEAPKAGHAIDDDENSERADTFPNSAELVADPGPTAPTDTGIVGGLKRAAGTILNPAAVLGVAAAPVRRIVGPGGQTDNPTDSDTKLRSIGDQLITASQQPVAKPSRRHPAFGDILAQLTPDEARIVRFLAVAGPQPSIDIRTKTLFQIGSERLAAGINMIAEMAGCRWPEFDDRYLVNLNRLGLVRFSTEPVDDYRRYALLEVQPRALDATEKAARSISVYRSVYLSTFGQQFCDVCIDTTGYDAGGWATNERGDKIKGNGPPDPARAGHKH